ncbi:MAG: hypothetical protein ABGY75_08705, partial [Gemmataceae bacterium]
MKKLTLGQRFRVNVDVYSRYSTSDYLVAEEHIPSGALFVEGSLSGSFTRYERRGQKLVMYFKPGGISDINYELVAHAPGKYRSLPTVFRDATQRSRMRLGSAGSLEILPPGGESGDPYNMNPNEHFELARKMFEDGRFDDALVHLEALYNNPSDRVGF